MPDLTVEYHWMCQDNDRFLTYIKGSKGDEYRVDFTGRNQEWHCSCKGFQFHHTCKHVQEAEKKRCTWNAFHDDGTPVDVQMDDEHPNGYACPRCGGEVTSQGYGV